MAQEQILDAAHILDPISESDLWSEDAWDGNRQMAEIAARATASLATCLSENRG